MFWNDIKAVKSGVEYSVDELEKVKRLCLELLDKLETLEADARERSFLAIKTLKDLGDMVENRFSSLEKMINELKGCVSMARSAVPKRKKPSTKK